MEITFNCPHCDQELAVDQAGAGTQIDCPTCGESIIIPSTGKVTTGNLPPVPPPSAAATTAHTPAPRKELHLKVPVRDTPAEVLIGKPKPPLEAVQKGAGKRIRIHTIRHASCIESGHDHFDERVSAYLQEVGESNIVSLHFVNYEHFDVGIQKIMTDYGIVVIFRG